MTEADEVKAFLRRGNDEIDEAIVLIREANAKLHNAYSSIVSVPFVAGLGPVIDGLLVMERKLEESIWIRENVVEALEAHINQL